MELKQEVFDKMNNLEYIFDDVETLSRVLKSHDDTSSETGLNDKLVLIHLLFDKILVMKNCLDEFTSSLIK